MDEKQKRLARIVKQFRKRAIGVLGDFMLDELIRGEASRISPEAPVPVVLVDEPHDGAGFPGGAGNVAANIAALGGSPVPFGAIGADESGRKLLSLLKARRIPSHALFAERDRLTPRKVRIIARQHQLLRLDFERCSDISSPTESRLAMAISRSMSRLDALIISDYQKGSVPTSLCNKASNLARQKRIPVFVDPKPEHPEICRHATMATPNLHEAELMLGRPLRTRHDLLMGGQRLLADLGCSALLITRGREGMMLFRDGYDPYEIAAVARPVYDVTGAGDTVLAVVALAAASGASLEDAAELANLAGGQVVLKFGTAEVTPVELMEAVARGSDEN